MLRIRLQPVKQKNKVFNIVLTNRLFKRDGKIFSLLGTYNVINKQYLINVDKLSKALKCGAYPSNSVRHFLNRLIERYSS